MPDGVLRATARFKEATQVVVAIGVVRIALKRLLIRHNCLIGTLLILEQDAQVEK
jgi:hypothetical protein